ncbi:hypothetical protein F4561_004870 [Lipingzhangella halophila]|uniref:Uncharacterized protein n=1 Tax=Lipingzhangella halophila TaxID=1783352 RepID=A0A7W7W5Q5_9ACTN|nr:hypothetical protein [Lipingzhangella halophila]MBB4934050.1 hypothetical protein [Lipingzhangella halophila]
MSPPPPPSGAPSTDDNGGSGADSPPHGVDDRSIPGGAEIPPGPGSKSQKRWARPAVALSSCTLLVLVAGYAFAAGGQAPMDSWGSDASEPTMPAVPPPVEMPASPDPNVTTRATVAPTAPAAPAAPPEAPEPPAEPPASDAPPPEEPAPADPPDTGDRGTPRDSPEERLEELIEEYRDYTPPAPR